MNIRLAGALLVLLGCGSVGFSIAAESCFQERSLRHLLNALDYMQCELLYRQLPLPDLCRKVGEAGFGQISAVFLNLAEELEHQNHSNASLCLKRVIEGLRGLPVYSKEALEELGRNLGRFDLDGQICGFEAVRNSCVKKLEILTRDKTVRLRSYQTLGLCAGAALAILFI